MIELSKSLESLEKIKEMHPEIDFSIVEKGITLALKREDDTFYRLMREDFTYRFNEAIEDDILLNEISEDLKKELYNRVYDKIKDKFFIDDWSEIVDGWIASPINELRCKYVCKNINPDWENKWDAHYKIMQSERVSSFWLNSFDMENFESALFSCLKIFSEEGKSDILDSALEDIRKFERNGFITYEQFEKLMDLWFN